MEFIKESNQEIGVVGSNGKNRRDDPFALSYGIADEPAWSPDDKRLAFVAFGSGQVDSAAIVVGSTLHPNRPRNHVLTDFRHRDLAPTWSPFSNHSRRSPKGPTGSRSNQAEPPS
jgi:Tol biopolymer transport system component